MYLSNIDNFDTTRLYSVSTTHINEIRELTMGVSGTQDDCTRSEQMKKDI